MAGCCCPFCPAVFDTAKAAGRQCSVLFLGFFCSTGGLSREILLGGFQVGECSTLTMLFFPIHLPGYSFAFFFFCLGTEFRNCFQGFIPWLAMQTRGREEQQEALPTEHSSVE